MSAMTVISAPGKVLIAGGYLVLVPAYTGIVIAASSRFYTVVQDGKATAGSIVVRSPQFTDGLWEYQATVTEDGVDLEQVQQGSTPVARNKFVQLALQRTLLLSHQIKGPQSLRDSLSHGLEITIVGGNDFYSQRAQLAARNLPRTIDALDSLPPFVPCEVPISQVHKTGLGSSAALITSLVCALLLHTQAVSASGLEGLATHDRRLVHNAAQYVHCLAQGKVGSGFDVASAVFGSQIYRRFDPAVLEPLMVDVLSPSLLLPSLSPDNKAWDHHVTPFILPPHMRLMLADVDAGSDTPSLVGRVLSWRKNNAEESLQLWTTISQANTRLAAALTALNLLCTKHSQTYKEDLNRLSDLPRSEWKANSEGSHQEIITGLLGVVAASEDIRSGMRQMGTLANVPIEPEEQTRLLDACLLEAGAVAGGVPGAGGYDAIWVLVLEGNAPSASPLKRVESVWQSWTEMTVSPLSASESHERGLRVEILESIPGLKDIIQPK